MVREKTRKMGLNIVFPVFPVAQTLFLNHLLWELTSVLSARLDPLQPADAIIMRVKGV